MSKVQIIKGTEKPRRFTNNVTEKIRVAPYCRVSTDSDDQLESYKTQVAYYNELVNSNPEWEMVDIYADEAITGTQTKNRTDFMRMIDDCMNGKIDMVITKAISRFARNTVDTLTYVRQLKEKGIAVFFEEQNINTLTTEGEFLLTILSSVAQQEVENISANVKFGHRARMKAGKNVGFRKCLGYEYDTKTQVFTINEKEAEIVRYIFERYIAGKGAQTIARELGEKGYKPLRAEKWAWTSVIAILKNVKYKGDLEMGKTYVTDPISKKRLVNLGEKDSYYVASNHEPIISADDFDKAQTILNKRGETIMHKGKRWDKYSRQYPFSSMIYCAFCESVYSRRNLYSGTDYEKRVWSCADAVKRGRKVCPDSISKIDEKELEQAFVEAFRLMCSDNKDIITEFLQRVESSLNENSYTKELAKVEKNISYLKTRIDRLLELLLDNSIVKSEYDLKRRDLLDDLEKTKQEQAELLSTVKNDKQLKKRLAEFKAVLGKNEAMNEFDSAVFENMIEKIIIGEIDEQGNKNPYKITFVFKTGYTSDTDAPPPKKAGRPRKKSIEAEDETMELENNNTCSYEIGHTVVVFSMINWE
ncbi:MAG: recombinase family protein [Oscillospiraceae bacterium]|jgi:DNA invertase Pin-like site-specific DNA recombinase|nr:recombinase family protein [Oscillospiraceae bacterium]